MLNDQLRRQWTHVSSCHDFCTFWKLCVHILRNTGIHPYCQLISVLIRSNTNRWAGLVNTHSSTNTITDRSCLASSSVSCIWWASSISLTSSSFCCLTCSFISSCSSATCRTTRSDHSRVWSTTRSCTCTCHSDVFVREGNLEKWLWHTGHESERHKCTHIYKHVYMHKQASIYKTHRHINSIPLLPYLQIHKVYSP